MLRYILSPITCWWNLASQSTQQLILLRKSWRLPRELVQHLQQLSCRRSSLLQDPQGVGSAHYHFAPAIALQLQPPRERKALCITDTSLLPRASRKTKQLNWLTNMRCDLAISQEYRPGEGWLHPVPFPPGATVSYIPYHSPTICLFRVDNRILSQKHTALSRPCLAASAKHWGSSLNECIWASHKFLEEKVMQIFHLHSSRLWPQGNLCGCVVSTKGFQVLSDLACEINSHVKGLGFVQKYCWKAAQWFLWLNGRGVLVYSYSLARGGISIQLQLQYSLILQHLALQRHWGTPCPIQRHLRGTTTSI